MSWNSSTAETMLVKHNGALVTMSGFQVWSRTSQATSYICDPVLLTDREVSHLYKSTDFTRNSHCPLSIITLEREFLYLCVTLISGVIHFTPNNVLSLQPEKSLSQTEFSRPSVTLIRYCYQVNGLG